MREHAAYALAQPAMRRIGMMPLMPVGSRKLPTIDVGYT
jgi:hypothetical protein